MHLSCLCPTYGRPSLVSNAAALFLMQRLRPQDTAALLVLDDASQIKPQTLTSEHHRKTVRVFNHDGWIRLQLKYPILADQAGRSCVYVIWDDDDLYLPWHLQAIAEALEGVQCGLAHPTRIWSTYSTRPEEVPLAQRLHQDWATGRFHGAAAVTEGLLAAAGGWCTDDRADYDQEHLHRWGRCGRHVDTCAKWPPSYVYRWADTARWHVSGRIEDNRYAQPPIQEPGSVDWLHPALDESSRVILEVLAGGTGEPAAVSEAA
jgi:hypothetical protein